MKRYPFVFLVLAAVVLAPASVFAGNSTSGHEWLSELRTDDAAPIISTDLPWASARDMLFQDDKSVFWNSYYRIGKGTLQLNGVEFIEYDYNNKTDRVDSGKIREIHNTVTFTGVPVSNFRLMAGIGLANIGINLGDDGTDKFFNHSGLVYDLGMEVGFPIGDVVTLMARASWRSWEVSRDTLTAGRQNAWSQQWRAQGLISFELFGKRNDFSMNLFLGGGWQYVVQRWEIGGSTEAITPDNSESQTNGPGRYVALAGLSMIFNDWFAGHLEVRFLGPLTIIAGINLII